MDERIGTRSIDHQLFLVGILPKQIQVSCSPYPSIERGCIFRGNIKFSNTPDENPVLITGHSL